MTDLTFHLTKERGQSLGIGFRKLTKPPHCEVSILVENGVAAMSGLIHVGDILLTVNGINVHHLSPNEVGGVLVRHSVDASITLEVRRNDNMNLSTNSRDRCSLTPDIDSTMDMDSATDTDIDDSDNCTPNGHPEIEVHSPPVSPDCVSPIVDAPVPETSVSPAIGWKGNQRNGQRVRRINAMTGCGLPEIQEAAPQAKDNLTSHSLNVQAPTVHRHSLTPEAVRKPLEDLKRANLRSSKSLDLANLPQWRAGNSSQQNVTLHNLLDGTEMSDRLYTNGIKVHIVGFFAVGIVLL